MQAEKTKAITEKKSEEKDLFAKIKKRDKEAFIKAYDLYIDHIYRFVYFKVGSQEEAQDLTSAVFLKTWNYIQENSLEDIKTLKALIYKIARTSIIDYYRKSQPNNITIDNEDNKLDISDERQNFAKQMEISSEFRIIENKLKELKDEYREVIVLRYIDEMSVKEIANIINKSRSNVRVIIHRAIKVLKKLMEENDS